MASARHIVIPHLPALSSPPRSLSLPAWRYELHLYLDYGFPLSVLSTLIPALHSAFPFFRLTHSQLLPLQHLSLLLDCWEQSRCQLNGLSVLDVLEQQWEAVRGGAAVPAPVSSTGATSTRQRRKRQRESGGSTQGSAAQLMATSSAKDKVRLWQRAEQAEDATQQNVAVFDGSSDGQEVKAVPPTAVSRQFPLSNHSSLRRAEYVLATNYSATAAVRADPPSTTQPPTLAPFHLTLQSLLGSFHHESVADLQQSNIHHPTRTVHYSLFLTEYDCFVPGLTFVFGVARLTRCALVSLHRLEGQSSAATAAFLAKECVHEVGHLFSLHHCTMPCVMTYSTTVEEALQKDSHLCPSCVAKLQWMQRGVIIKPDKQQQQPPLGSVEAAAEAAAARAMYR